MPWGRWPALGPPWPPEGIFGVRVSFLPEAGLQALLHWALLAGICPPSPQPLLDYSCHFCHCPSSVPCPPGSLWMLPRERVPADYMVAWLRARPSAFGPSAVGSERRHCKCWESSRILSLLNSFWRPRATGKPCPAPQLLNLHGHCEGRVGMLWLLSHPIQAPPGTSPGLPSQPSLVSPTDFHLLPSDPPRNLLPGCPSPAFHRSTTSQT